MTECPKCKLENTELHWLQLSNGRFVCAWCYNGNYTPEQITKQRSKYAKKKAKEVLAQTNALQDQSN